MSVLATPKVTTLAPWYGSDRMVAARYAKALAGCTWVGIPFAGGMSIAAYLDARTIVLNDRHSHIVNLARVAADPVLGPKLYRSLRRLPLHPNVLKDAQERCRHPEDGSILDWARAYFICAWMGRNGTAGTPGEFTAKISMRWESNGGDSAVRVQSMVLSLVAWRRVLRRATFTTLDAFEFIGKCRDEDRCGLYVDAPWPDDGDGYSHTFETVQQERLAAVLGTFKRTKVVVRYGVHPLIERLYPRTEWDWELIEGRTQANGAKVEAMITRRKVG